MANANLEESKIQIMNAENTYLFPGPPVWEFEVHVASSVAKNVFNVHSAMTWDEVEWKILKNLDGVCVAGPTCIQGVW